MSEFKNVTIIKKANVYFDGQGYQPHYSFFRMALRRPLVSCFPGTMNSVRIRGSSWNCLPESWKSFCPGVTGGKPYKEVILSKFLPGQNSN